MTTVKFLLSNLGSWRGLFSLLLLVGFLDGAAGFSVPILLAEFTKNPRDTATLIPTVLPLIAACLCATLGLQWCLRRWAEALQGWFANELRTSLFMKAEKLSIDSLSHYHSGYLASLINQVAGSIGHLATAVIWLMGHLTITLSLFFIFTARESVLLACINLLLLSVFVGVSVLLSRKIVPLADSVNTAAALVGERFFDLLTNISTIKRLGIASWAKTRLEYTSLKSNRAIATFQRFHANRWFILHAIFFSSFLTTLAFLLSQIEMKLLAPASLILFVSGFSTVRGHAERLSELIKTALETGAYVDRLQRILFADKPLGTFKISLLEVISCHDLSFQHRTSSHRISVPTFTLGAGERVLITGRSGQGKTTLLSLLANQREPTSGNIRWNGIPYENFDESLHHAFAIVSQEVELFNISLRENLSLGRSISDEMLHSTLEKLDLSDLVKNLPDGLHTPVGEKGLRLSAGQKQRINLARAFLLNRPILLLDEPTAHLDTATEQIVIRYLSELSPTTTMVIVSHSTSLGSLCNRHYEFIDGVLCESHARNCGV